LKDVRLTFPKNPNAANDEDREAHDEALDLAMQDMLLLAQGEKIDSQLRKVFVGGLPHNL
jgi:hypothetical protein